MVLNTQFKKYILLKLNLNIRSFALQNSIVKTGELSISLRFDTFEPI